MPPAEPQSDVTSILDTPEAGGRVVAGGALRVAAYVVGSLISVVSAAFVAQHLGPSEFGRFTTVTSLSMVALVVTDFGIAALGVREFVARRGPERDHMMRALVGLRLMLMASGAVAITLFALAAGFSSELVVGTALTGVGLIVYALPASYVIPLQATLRLGWVGGLDLVRQITQAILLVGLVLAGAGVAPLLGAAIPASFAALLLGLVAVRGLAPLKPLIDLRESRRLMRMAMTFAVATSIGTLYAYAAQVVADLSTTAEESGLFALSFRVFVVVIGTAMIAVSSAFPVFTRAAGGRDQARIGYAGTRSYEAMALLGGLAAIGIGVGAPLVVRILGGNEFDGAEDVVRLHAIAIPGSFAVAVGSFLLLALGRQRALLRLNAGVLAVSLLLTWAMATKWGAMGAAGSMVVTEMSLAVGYFTILSRGKYGIGYGARSARGVTAGLVAAVAAAIGVEQLAGGLAGDIAQTVAAVAVFAGVSAACGAIPDEVLKLLRDRFQRRPA